MSPESRKRLDELAAMQSDDEWDAPTPEALRIVAMFLDDAPYEPTLIAVDADGTISIEDICDDGAYRIVEINDAGQIRDYAFRDREMIFENPWRPYES